MQTKSNYELANELKEQGNQFFSKKDYHYAISCYDKALALNESFKEVLVNKALCCRHLGDFDGALFALDRAIKIAPLYAKAVYNKAGILHDNGKSELALQAIDTYLKIGEDNSDIIGLRKKIAEISVKNILGKGVFVNINDFFKQAEICIRKQDNITAQKYLKAVIILEPHNTKAKKMLSAVERIEESTSSPLVLKSEPNPPKKTIPTQKFSGKEYFYVKQGRISCWEYTERCRESYHYGFYTEKFYNCVVVILRSRDRNKIALIHADSTISLQDIKDVVAWTGEGSEKIIYAKKSPDADETINDLFKDEIVYKKYFIIKNIEPIKKKNKMLFDPGLPALPDGSRIPEFEYNVVWVDFKADFGTRFHAETVGMVDDDRVIGHCYVNYQIPKCGSFSNRKGSNLTAQYKEIIENQQKSAGFLNFIFECVRKGDYGNLRSQLDIGLDVNVRINGYTLLALASAEGHEKLVGLLLSRGAIVDKHIILEGMSGGTPLFLAAGRGHLRIVQKLLESGANPDFTTAGGNTPLKIALIQKEKKVSELLRQVQSSSRQKKEELFVHVPQGYTGRIDRTVLSKGISGIYTERFLTCSLIVLCSRDKQKMSLTHADTFVTESDIKEEIDWVGQDCEKRVLFLEGENQGLEMFMPTLSKEFKKIPFSFSELEKMKGIKLDLKGEVIKSSSIPLYDDHPQEALMSAFRYVNELCRHFLQVPNALMLGPINNHSIIYDGKNWCNPLGHDLALTTYSKRCLRYFQHLNSKSKEDEWLLALKTMWLAEAQQVLKDGNDIANSLYSELANQLDSSEILVLYIKKFFEIKHYRVETFLSEACMPVLPVQSVAKVPRDERFIDDKPLQILSEFRGSAESHFDNEDLAVQLIDVNDEPEIDDEHRSGLNFQSFWSQSIDALPDGDFFRSFDDDFNDNDLGPKIN